MDTKYLYSIGDACHLLSMSRSSLNRLIKARKIRSIKEGGMRRIPATAIDQYIKRTSKASMTGGLS
jgi:excisionase family DNA binding protein